MRRLLALPLLVALAAPVFAPAAVGAAVACASETGPHAALVIDTGAHELELCVKLSGADVNGLELIRLAAQQYGLDYELGFGGQAVCRLAGVGPTGGDCFADYPDYWGFWRGGPGGWTWSGTGAGSSSVADGGMQGWTWGSGDSGATHPRLPAVTIDDVCPPPPEPDPAPATADGGSGGESGNPAGGTDAPSARASASPPRSAASPSPRRSSTPTTSGHSSRSTPAGDPTLLADGGGTQDGGGGSPVGSIAAVGAIIALALGGTAVARRRGKAEA